MKKFVGYYRVSTKGQGRSGLGLDSQQATVRSFVACQGYLVGEVTEIESGAVASRTGLSEALALCQRERAILVIAKLDRLSRNVRFISQLMEAGVEFMAVDMPSANKLTVHIIAAIAEHERDLISQRTKAALAAAKARGAVLGNPNLSKVRQFGVNARVAKAEEFARKTYPLMIALRKAGASSFLDVAEGLNNAGVKTQRSKSWTPAGVRNVMLRAQRHVT